MRWPISSEWPRRQQDEDLDQLGESVTRIGHLGLTIHEELQTQATCVSEVTTSIRMASRLCACLSGLHVCGGRLSWSTVMSTENCRMMMMRWLIWPRYVRQRAVVIMSSANCRAGC